MVCRPTLPGRISRKQGLFDLRVTVPSLLPRLFWAPPFGDPTKEESTLRAEEERTPTPLAAGVKPALPARLACPPGVCTRRAGELPLGGA